MRPCKERDELERLANLAAEARKAANPLDRSAVRAENEALERLNQHIKKHGCYGESATNAQGAGS